MIWTLFGDVWATFRADRARFLLTLSGIVIGVASLVMLSGLLEGGKEALLSASQQATEDNVVKVRPGEVPEKQRLRTTRPLELRDQSTLAHNGMLEGASVEVEQEVRTEARSGKARGWVRFVGSAPSARELYSLELSRGRFLTELDVQSSARVAVVGDKVFSDILGSPKSLDGVELVAKGERWEVVGVLKHKAILGGGEGTWMWDRKVVVPRTAFASAYRSDGRVDHLFVRLAFTQSLADRVKAVRGVVRQTVLRNHYGVKNFQIEGEGEDDAKFDLIMGIIRMLLMTTAVLSLVVGGINIMNIMLVSVTERTREIGVRRALGASKRTILFHFLAESALVAALGGFVGAASGLAVNRVASWGLSVWLGEWKFHIIGWSIIAGIAAAALTGVLFGLYPAWRAARLDPAEALRFE
jgi:putative ABC transport system permease protein